MLRLKSADFRKQRLSAQANRKVIPVPALTIRGAILRMLAAVPEITRAVYSLDAQHKLLIDPGVPDRVYTQRLEHNLCMLTHTQYYTSDQAHYIDGPRLYSPANSSRADRVRFFYRAVTNEIASLVPAFPILPWKRIYFHAFDPRPSGSNASIESYIKKEVLEDIHNPNKSVLFMIVSRDTGTSFYSHLNECFRSHAGCFSLKDTRWRVYGVSFLSFYHCPENQNVSFMLNAHTRAHVGPGCDVFSPPLPPLDHRQPMIVCCTRVTTQGPEPFFEVDVPDSPLCSTSAMAILDEEHSMIKMHLQSATDYLSHFNICGRHSKEHGQSFKYLENPYVLNSLINRIGAATTNLRAISLHRVQLYHGPLATYITLPNLNELNIVSCMAADVRSPEKPCLLDHVLGATRSYTNLTKLHIYDTRVYEAEVEAMVFANCTGLRSLQLVNVYSDTLVSSILKPTPDKEQAVHHMLSRLELLDLDLHGGSLETLDILKHIKCAQSLTLRRLRVSRDSDADQADVVSHFNTLSTLQHLALYEVEAKIPISSLLLHLEIVRRDFTLRSEIPMTNLVSLRYQSKGPISKDRLIEIPSHMTNLTQLDLRDTMLENVREPMSEQKQAEYARDIEAAFGKLSKLKSLSLFSCIWRSNQHMQCVIGPALKGAMRGPLEELQLGSRVSQDLACIDDIMQVIKPAPLRSLTVTCDTSKLGMISPIVNYSRSSSTLTQLNLMVLDTAYPDKTMPFIRECVRVDPFGAAAPCALTLIFLDDVKFDFSRVDALHQAAVILNDVSAHKRIVKMKLVPWVPMSSLLCAYPMSPYASTVMTHDIGAPVLFDHLSPMCVANRMVLFQRRDKTFQCPPNCLFFCYQKAYCEGKQIFGTMFKTRMPGEGPHFIDLLHSHKLKSLTPGKMITIRTATYIIHDPHHALEEFMKMQGWRRFSWVHYTTHTMSTTEVLDIISGPESGRKRTAKEAFEAPSDPGLVVSNLHEQYAKMEVPIVPRVREREREPGQLRHEVIAFLEQMMVSVDQAAKLCDKWQPADSSTHCGGHQLAQHVTDLIASGRIGEYLELTRSIHPERRALVAAVCACLCLPSAESGAPVYSECMRTYVQFERFTRIRNLIESLEIFMLEAWAHLRCAVPEVASLGIQYILVPHTSPSMLYELLSDLPLDRKMGAVSQYSKFLENAGIEMRTAQSPPPELCCALSAFSTQLRDPVLVTQNGISYSRKALDSARQAFASHSFKLPGLFVAGRSNSLPKGGTQVSAIPNFLLKNIVSEITGERSPTPQGSPVSSPSSESTENATVSRPSSSP